MISIYVANSRITIPHSAMFKGNTSWTTEIPIGEEFDTKTVEFLLSENQKYLVFLLLFLAVIIIFANR